MTLGLRAAGLGRFDNHYPAGVNICNARFRHPRIQDENLGLVGPELDTSAPGVVDISYPVARL